MCVPAIGPMWAVGRLEGTSPSGSPRPCTPAVQTDGGVGSRAQHRAVPVRPRRLIELPGKTIAEKIFSAHSGTDAHAGDIVVADVDFVMGQDGTTPLAIKALERMGVDEVFDPAKVAVVMDHSSPSPIEGVSRRCTP